MIGLGLITQVPLLRIAARNAGEQLTLNRDGLVFRVGGQERRCAWADIRALRRNDLLDRRYSWGTSIELANQPAWHLTRNLCRKLLIPATMRWFEAATGRQLVSTGDEPLPYRHAGRLFALASATVVLPLFALVIGFAVYHRRH